MRAKKKRFVVSKKIHKRAVKRNKIKRLAREASRLMLKNKDLKWTSLIFQARAKALDSNFHEVYNSIEQLIEKAEKKF